jgi:hypothetical protein
MRDAMEKESRVSTHKYTVRYKDGRVVLYEGTQLPKIFEIDTGREISLEEMTLDLGTLFKETRWTAPDVAKVSPEKSIVAPPEIFARSSPKIATFHRDEDPTIPFDAIGNDLDVPELINVSRFFGDPSLDFGLVEGYESENERWNPDEIFDFDPAPENTSEELSRLDDPTRTPPTPEFYTQPGRSQTPSSSPGDLSMKTPPTPADKATEFPLEDRRSASPFPTMSPAPSRERPRFSPGERERVRKTLFPGTRDIEKERLRSIADEGPSFVFELKDVGDNENDDEDNADEYLRDFEDDDDVESIVQNDDGTKVLRIVSRKLAGSEERDVETTPMKRPRLLPTMESIGVSPLPREEKIRKVPPSRETPSPVHKKRRTEEILTDINERVVRNARSSPRSSPTIFLPSSPREAFSSSPSRRDPGVEETEITTTTTTTTMIVERPIPQKEDRPLNLRIEIRGEGKAPRVLVGGDLPKLSREKKADGSETTIDVLYTPSRSIGIEESTKVRVEKETLRTEGSHRDSTVVRLNVIEKSAKGDDEDDDNDRVEESALEGKLFRLIAQPDVYREWSDALNADIDYPKPEEILCGIGRPIRFPQKRYDTMVESYHRIWCASLRFLDELCERERSQPNNDRTRFSSARGTGFGNKGSQYPLSKIFGDFAYYESLGRSKPTSFVSMLGNWTSVWMDGVTYPCLGFFVLMCLNKDRERGTINYDVPIFDRNPKTGEDRFVRFLKVKLQASLLLKFFFLATEMRPKDNRARVIEMLKWGHDEWESRKRFFEKLSVDFFSLLTEKALFPQLAIPFYATVDLLSRGEEAIATTLVKKATPLQIGALAAKYVSLVPKNVAWNVEDEVSRLQFILLMLDTHPKEIPSLLHRLYLSSERPEESETLEKKISAAAELDPERYGIAGWDAIWRRLKFYRENWESFHKKIRTSCPNFLSANQTTAIYASQYSFVILDPKIEIPGISLSEVFSRLSKQFALAVETVRGFATVPASAVTDIPEIFVETVAPSPPRAVRILEEKEDIENVVVVEEGEGGLDVGGIGEKTEEDYAMEEMEKILEGTAKLGSWEDWAFRPCELTLEENLKKFRESHASFERSLRAYSGMVVKREGRVERGKRSEFLFLAMIESCADMMKCLAHPTSGLLAVGSSPSTIARLLINGTVDYFALYSDGMGDVFDDGVDLVDEGRNSLRFHTAKTLEKMKRSAIDFKKREAMAACEMIDGLLEFCIGASTTTTATLETASVAKILSLIGGDVGELIRRTFLLGTYAASVYLRDRLGSAVENQLDLDDVIAELVQEDVETFPKSLFESVGGEVKNVETLSVNSICMYAFNGLKKFLDTPDVGEGSARSVLWRHVLKDPETGLGFGAPFSDDRLSTSSVSSLEKPSMVEGQLFSAVGILAEKDVSIAASASDLRERGTAEVPIFRTFGPQIPSGEIKTLASLLYTKKLVDFAKSVEEFSNYPFLYLFDPNIAKKRFSVPAIVSDEEKTQKSPFLLYEISKDSKTVRAVRSGPLALELNLLRESSKPLVHLIDSLIDYSNWLHSVGTNAITGEIANHYGAFELFPPPQREDAGEFISKWNVHYGKVYVPNEFPNRDREKDKRWWLLLWAMFPYMAENRSSFFEDMVTLLTNPRSSSPFSAITTEEEEESEKDLSAAASIEKSRKKTRKAWRSSVGRPMTRLVADKWSLIGPYFKKGKIPFVVYDLSATAVLKGVLEPTGDVAKEYVEKRGIPTIPLKYPKNNEQFTRALNNARKRSDAGYANAAVGSSSAPYVCLFDALHFEKTSFSVAFRYFFKILTDASKVFSKVQTLTPYLDLLPPVVYDENGSVISSTNYDDNVYSACETEFRLWNSCFEDLKRVSDILGGSLMSRKFELTNVLHMDRIGTPSATRVQKRTISTVALFGSFASLSDSVRLCVSCFFSSLTEMLEEFELDGDEPLDFDLLRRRMAPIMQLAINLWNFNLQAKECRDQVYNAFRMSRPASGASRVSTTPKKGAPATKEVPDVTGIFSECSLKAILGKGSDDAWFKTVHLLVLGDALNSVVNVTSMIQRILLIYKLACANFKKRTKTQMPPRGFEPEKGEEWPKEYVKPTVSTSEELLMYAFDEDVISSEGKKAKSKKNKEDEDEDEDEWPAWSLKHFQPGIFTTLGKSVDVASIPAMEPTIWTDAFTAALELKKPGTTGENEKRWKELDVFCKSCLSTPLAILKETISFFFGPVEDPKKRRMNFGTSSAISFFKVGFGKDPKSVEIFQIIKKSEKAGSVASGIVAVNEKWRVVFSNPVRKVSTVASLEEILKSGSNWGATPPIVSAGNVGISGRSPSPFFDRHYVHSSNLEVQTYRSKYGLTEKKSKKPIVSAVPSKVYSAPGSKSATAPKSAAKSTKARTVTSPSKSVLRLASSPTSREDAWSDDTPCTTFGIAAVSKNKLMLEKPHVKTTKGDEEPTILPPSSSPPRRLFPKEFGPELTAWKRIQKKRGGRDFPEIYFGNDAWRDEDDEEDEDWNLSRDGRFLLSGRVLDEGGGTETSLLQNSSENFSFLKLAFGLGRGASSSKRSVLFGTSDVSGYGIRVVSEPAEGVENALRIRVYKDYEKIAYRLCDALVYLTANHRPSIRAEGGNRTEKSALTVACLRIEFSPESTAKWFNEETKSKYVFACKPKVSLRTTEKGEKTVAVGPSSFEDVGAFVNSARADATRIDEEDYVAELSKKEIAEGLGVEKLSTLWKGKRPNTYVLLDEKDEDKKEGRLFSYKYNRSHKDPQKIVAFTNRGLGVGIDTRETLETSFGSKGSKDVLAYENRGRRKPGEKPTPLGKPKKVYAPCFGQDKKRSTGRAFEEFCAEEIGAVFSNALFSEDGKRWMEKIENDFRIAAGARVDAKDTIQHDAILFQSIENDEEDDGAQNSFDLFKLSDENTGDVVPSPATGLPVYREISAKEIPAPEIESGLTSETTLTTKVGLAPDSGTIWRRVEIPLNSNCKKLRMGYRPVRCFSEQTRRIRKRLGIAILENDFKDKTIVKHVRLLCSRSLTYQNENTDGPTRRKETVPLVADVSKRSRDPRTKNRMWLPFPDDFFRDKNVADPEKQFLNDSEWFLASAASYRYKVDVFAHALDAKLNDDFYDPRRPLRREFGKDPNAPGIRVGPTTVAGAATFLQLPSPSRMATMDGTTWWKRRLSEEIANLVYEIFAKTLKYDFFARYEKFDAGTDEVSFAFGQSGIKKRSPYLEERDEMMFDVEKYSKRRVSEATLSFVDKYQNAGAVIKMKEDGEMSIAYRPDADAHWLAARYSVWRSVFEDLLSSTVKNRVLVYPFKIAPGSTVSSGFVSKRRDNDLTGATCFVSAGTSVINPGKNTYGRAEALNRNIWISRIFAREACLARVDLVGRFFLPVPYRTDERRELQENKIAKRKNRPTMGGDFKSEGSDGTSRRDLFEIGNYLYAVSNDGENGSGGIKIAIDAITAEAQVSHPGLPYAFATVDPKDAEKTRIPIYKPTNADVMCLVEAAIATSDNLNQYEEGVIDHRVDGPDGRDESEERRRNVHSHQPASSFLTLRDHLESTKDFASVLWNSYFMVAARSKKEVVPVCYLNHWHAGGTHSGGSYFEETADRPSVDELATGSPGECPQTKCAIAACIHFESLYGRRHGDTIYGTGDFHRKTVGKKTTTSFFAAWRKALVSLKKSTSVALGKGVMGVRYEKSARRERVVMEVTFFVSCVVVPLSFASWTKTTRDVETKLEGFDRFYAPFSDSEMPGEFSFCIAVANHFEEDVRFATNWAEKPENWIATRTKIVSSYFSKMAAKVDRPSEFSRWRTPEFSDLLDDALVGEWVDYAVFSKPNPNVEGQKNVLRQRLKSTSFDDFGGPLLRQQQQQGEPTASASPSKTPKEVPIPPAPEEPRKEKTPEPRSRESPSQRRREERSEERFLLTPWTSVPNDRRKCLVLDIDHTLVEAHKGFDPSSGKYDFTFDLSPPAKGGKPSLMKRPLKIFVFKRPHVDEFLTAVREIYDEIVIFSAGKTEYVEAVVDRLDPDSKLIDYRLGADAVTETQTPFGLRHVKELTRLGRPLESIVAVDDTVEVYSDANNLVPVSRWHARFDPVSKEMLEESSSDAVLLNLIPKLKEIYGYANAARGIERTLYEDVRATFESLERPPSGGSKIV